MKNKNVSFKEKNLIFFDGGPEGQGELPESGFIEQARFELEQGKRLSTSLDKQMIPHQDLDEVIKNLAMALEDSDNNSVLQFSADLQKLTSQYDRERMMEEVDVEDVVSRLEKILRDDMVFESEGIVPVVGEAEGGLKVIEFKKGDEVLGGITLIPARGVIDYEFNLPSGIFRDSSVNYRPVTLDLEELRFKVIAFFVYGLRLARALGLKTGLKSGSETNFGNLSIQMVDMDGYNLPAFSVKKIKNGQLVINGSLNMTDESSTSPYAFSGRVESVKKLGPINQGYSDPSKYKTFEAYSDYLSSEYGELEDFKTPEEVKAYLEKLDKETD